MTIPEARITITVTTLNALSLSGPLQFCEIRRPKVTDSGGDRVEFRTSPRPALVVHKRGPIDLVFEVVYKRTLLVPLGMFFVQTEGSGDPRGAVNFPTQAVVNGKLTVRNKWVGFGSAGNAPAWKFFLVVRSPNNEFCLIDPEIQNEF